MYFFRIILTIFFVGLMLYWILSVRPFQVSGNSMETTLYDGQIVLADRLSFRFKPLKRWEIIIYRDMQRDGEIKIKRVLGLPGEILQIVQWKVTLWWLEVSESYLWKNTHTCLPGSCIDFSTHTFNVPTQSYFVLGDNRAVSQDSRWCTDVANCENKPPMYVPQKEIIGRVFFTW
jgi:signal peptidase I